jgi:hypothetical protein
MLEQKIMHKQYKLTLLLFLSLFCFVGCSDKSEVSWEEFAVENSWYFKQRTALYDIYTGSFQCCPVKKLQHNYLK